MPSADNTVVPFNATYSFPSQANKAVKFTSRQPPKSGGVYGPGNQIFIIFPAQGYINPAHSLLIMDVVLQGPVYASSTTPYAIRFQNNIQCIIDRMRLKYGAQEFEAILRYNVLVRFLTETTGTMQRATSDDQAISDGIGGTTRGSVVVNVGTSQSTTSFVASTGYVTLGVLSWPLGIPPAGTYISLAGAVFSNGVNTLNGLYQITSSTSDTVTFANPTTVEPSTLPTVQIVAIKDGWVNTRQAQVQGLEANFSGIPFSPSADFDFQGKPTPGNGHGAVPNNSIVQTLPSGVTIPAGVPFTVKRYEFNMAFGLFTQDKLIPVYWLGSDLNIEITLATAANCIYQPVGPTQGYVQAPTFQVGNVILLNESVKFDDSYDAKFEEALVGGGVPIKISTWSWFRYSTQGGSTVNPQIQERSRSVKGIVVLQTRGQDSFAVDNHASFFDTNTGYGITTDGTTMQEYQYRLGGLYYPGAPVQNSQNVGSNFSSGGAESLIEMKKFLNTIGNFELQTNVNVLNWAIPAIINGPTNLLPEYDYSYSFLGNNAYGVPNVQLVESSTSCFAGNMPSCCYASCISFENSNGVEISGLNAEEQADIEFRGRWSSPQNINMSLDMFTYKDKMLIVRPNNTLDVIS